VGICGEENYFRCRDFLTLCASKHNGVYPLKRKLLWMRQIWSLSIEMSGRFILDSIFISKISHKKKHRLYFYTLVFLKLLNDLIQDSMPQSGSYKLLF
jgi:hypothetical protein